MQSTGQRHHRDKLAKMLSRTTLLDVVGMTWSAWAIQNGHADHARRYMDFGPQATDGAAGAPFVLYPWQLETLVNEALASRHRPDARGRTLVTEQFSTILHLVKIVQRIEAADDRTFLQSHDVMYELHRLSQRQFEWQRGFANMPRFYRALDMFGHDAAGEHFENRLGCTVPAFIEAGFFVFAGSSSSPTRVWKDHQPPEGVLRSSVAKVLERISLPSNEAAREAMSLRSHLGHIGYKPSVLRRHPILRFGENGENAMAPVPPLVLQRITSGLYFDIVDGGGAVWADVGRRFESYCRRYLDAMLEGHAVTGDRRYGPKGFGFDTPDVLVSDARGVRLVVECKAKRMPVDARFSGDPVGDAAIGYAEIAKGVFQIWRFFSHARRGLFPETVASDCLGMVVTADPWLVMGQKLHPEVMAIAHRLADEKDPAIETCDRRRVPIVLIDDVEYLLQHSSADELFARLTALTKDPTGWEWSIVHDLEDRTDRPFPFADELAEMLPLIYSTKP